jgi:ATP-dependent Clp protease ATP-binding subunit ClpC
VEDEIAEGLLLGTMTDFSTIYVGVEDGKLSFKCEKIKS